MVEAGFIGFKSWEGVAGRGLATSCTSADTAESGICSSRNARATGCGSVASTELAAKPAASARKAAHSVTRLTGAAGGRAGTALLAGLGARKRWSIGSQFVTRVGMDDERTRATWRRR